MSEGNGAMALIMHAHGTANGFELNVTGADSQWVGRVAVTMRDPALLKPLAEAFAQFIAQQTGGIQIAGAGLADHLGRKS